MPIYGWRSLWVLVIASSALARPNSAEDNIACYCRALSLRRSIIRSTTPLTVVPVGNWISRSRSGSQYPLGCLRQNPILYTPSSSRMLHVDALRKNVDQLLTPACFKINGGARKSFGSRSGITIFAIASNRAVRTSPLLLNGITVTGSTSVEIGPDARLATVVHKRRLLEDNR
jgi:hypothetical protein